MLQPGGVFVLDTVNQVAFVRQVRPESWSELDDGTIFLERRIRPHHRPDAALFERAGLRLRDVYGGFDGSPVTPDSWRAVLVAHRDAA